MIRTGLLLILGLISPMLASAHDLPLGSFSLEKGLGCPTELRLQEKPACMGFVLQDLKGKTETDLCNVNNGKYLNRWHEEGMDFLVESKTQQESGLLQTTQVVQARRQRQLLRKSKLSMALFYRGGRLEMEKSRDGKALSCLYSRKTLVKLSENAD